MAIYSYDLQGKKDSFADWISNISPTDTFIVSKSKKESTPQPLYKWQIDALDKVVYDLASVDDILEGADYDPNATPVFSVRGTEEKTGHTQIFKKTFAISDSALATSVHGRAGELKYQLEKAAKELKNVMEVVFSSKQGMVQPGVAGAAPTVAAKTAGLFSQIAPLDTPNPDLPGTVAGTPDDTVVHISSALDKDAFDKITLALYKSGSKACVILANPINAEKLNAIGVDEGKVVRQLQVFETGIDDWEPGKKFNNEQFTITDIRGCNWCVCFSRFCPVDLVYFVDPETLTQRVLREPKATQLGRQGAFEIWQLVIEAGLCLSHPYAAGVIEVK